EQRQQEHQADLEKAMRDNPVLCNRCNQPRTDGSFFLSDGSVYYPRKVCQTCTDNNPHTIYRMKCPLIGLVRYIGITTQSLNKRLGQHMRDGYGVEYKQYWIGDLRAHSLKPL